MCIRDRDRAGCHAMCKLIEQVVRVLALGRRFVKMFDARFRRDAIASVQGGARLVDETERRHAEVGFFGETGRTGLGRLHEGEGGRMCAEERLDRRWRGF